MNKIRLIVTATFQYYGERPPVDQYNKPNSPG